MPFVAREPERYAGKVVGNGHCVGLVREATGAPHTGLWRRGNPVRGSNPASGTAIATFDPNGHYGNHTDGRSHAALLVSENSDGLLCWDQWLQHPTAQRVIRFRDGQGDAVNDGSRFYVIETADPVTA